MNALHHITVQKVLPAQGPTQCDFVFPTHDDLLKFRKTAKAAGWETLGMSPPDGIVPVSFELAMAHIAELAPHTHP